MMTKQLLAYSLSLACLLQPLGLYASQAEPVQADPESAWVAEYAVLEEGDLHTIDSDQPMDAPAESESPEEILQGYQQIDGKTYYYNEDGSLYYGWLDDTFFSYEDGSRQQGALWIDGENYYLDENGQKVADREVEIDGKTYRFDRDGKLVTGYYSDGLSNSFYSLFTGAKADGVHFYDGKYLFLGTPGSSAGIVESSNGQAYYVYPDGSVALDQLIEVEGKDRYFKSDGSMSRNEILQTDGQTFYTDTDGSFVNENSYKARNYALEVISMVGTGLRELFDWTIANIDYQHDVLDKPVEDYAVQAFETGLGNCMSYASAFSYLAETVGYTTRVICNWIIYDPNDHSNGTYHGWVLLNEDGKEYIYDPGAQHDMGDIVDLFRADPLKPPVRYTYSPEQEPLGGYRKFD